MTKQGEKLTREDTIGIFSFILAVMLTVTMYNSHVLEAQLSRAHTEAARLRGQTAKTPPTVQKLRNAYKALEAIITDQIDYSKKQAELNKALSAEVAELKERLGE